MKFDWKTMPTAHKIAFVISCIAVVLWLIPGLLPVDVTYPAIAVFTLCEAVICWKEKRKWAYLLIAAAVVCLGCFGLEFLL